MGLYEIFIGCVHIPCMLILLIAFSAGVARRQTNWLVGHVLNASFTVNNYRIKILPLLAVVNLICVYINLKEI